MTTPTPVPGPHSAGRTPRIAIVCRDDEAGEALTTFVADLGLEPVISQEPHAGASLEVLNGLREADFGVLLQLDRQLEIGFLLAVLGRGKLVVLHAGEVSGLPGLPRQPMDEAGVWRLLLAGAMKKAGIDVDLNRAV